MAIAVLPFQDLSPARDQSHFSEGIAEEILTALTHVPGLRVAGRAASFQSQAANLDLKEVAKRLDVDAVVKGAVRKVGDVLLVTVQLLDAPSGNQRWSHRFEGSTDGVFKFQEEICAAVAGQVRGELPASARQSLRRPETTSGAYEHFLRGRQLLRHQDEAFLSQAEEALRRAVEIDPKYAPAWAALAQVHAQRVEWYGGREPVRAAAEHASEQALRHGPELAEAHIARGVVLGMRRDYAGAEGEFREAVRRNPQSFDAHYQYARASIPLEKYEQAAELFQKAAKLQPEDFQALILADGPLQRLRRAEEAARCRREGIRRAERLLEWNPNNTRALSLGACALAESGDRVRALAWCDRAVKAGPDDVGVNYNAGCLYAKLGKADEALACLERTFGRGYGKRDWVERDADWNLLRDNARFKELLAKLA